jgi:hypothetical protein
MVFTIILHIEIYKFFVNSGNVTGDLFYINCVQQLRKEKRSTLKKQAYKHNARFKCKKHGSR